MEQTTQDRARARVAKSMGALTIEKALAIETDIDTQIAAKAAEEAKAEVPAADTAKPVDPAKMNKTDLLAHLSSLGLPTDPNATKQQLLDVLAATKPTE